MGEKVAWMEKSTRHNVKFAAVCSFGGAIRLLVFAAVGLVILGQHLEARH
jgi:hypothetical protein